MRMKLISIGFTLLWLCVQISAQGKSELDRLDDRFARHLEKAMPGWTHRRIEPFTPDSDVLVHSWSSSNRVVKIAVTVHNSSGDAKSVLDHFVKNIGRVQQLKGFGDEAYVWGFESSALVLQRGRFLVFLSIYADVDADADARTLTKSELHERLRSEHQRIGREFAKQVLIPLDLP